ncbi:sec-independent protein translocase protein TatB [Nakamurella sp. UYEF19]|uniref:Sec-independent protein translocase protein TatB n=1 Tax=Nakamurella sp. UYEF19 TaxID=1756392 RepID=UPI00339648D0
MSWPEIIIILAVGMFVLGPERIPVAVKWVGSTLKTVRTMAAGAQEQLRGEFGPEIDELRRQVEELQGLKEIQDLRKLRDLNPRAMIQKNILGEEFSGGIGGFLGLNQAAETTGSGVAEEPAVATPLITDQPVSFDKPVSVEKPNQVETIAQASLPEVTAPEVPVTEARGVDVQAPGVPVPTHSVPAIHVNEPVSAPRHAAPTSFDADAT